MRAVSLMRHSGCIWARRKRKSHQHMHATYADDVSHVNFFTANAESLYRKKNHSLRRFASENCLSENGKLLSRKISERSWLCVECLIKRFC